MYLMHKRPLRCPLAAFSLEFRRSDVADIPEGKRYLVDELSVGTMLLEAGFPLSHLAPHTEHDAHRQRALWHECRVVAQGIAQGGELAHAPKVQPVIRQS